MTDKKNHSMVCDVKKGICGVSDSDELEMIDFNKPKKITLYYVTDPICSHCWQLNLFYAVLRSNTEITFIFTH